MDVAASPGRLACADHPERHAHARCMSCHRLLCDECATEWDGINHCRPCLEARRAATTARGDWLGRTLVVAAIAVLAFAHSKLLVWIGVLVAPLL
jgi:hypothetical protein